MRRADLFYMARRRVVKGLFYLGPRSPEIEICQVTELLVTASEIRFMQVIGDPM
jgi:hypothetical protein